jgi:hypothetical protein
MWDAQDDGTGDGSDLHVAIRGGKDVPCNTHAYVDLRHGALNLFVSCRSNDALWGAYGANAVHFSFLQEFLAAAVGVPVGLYYQMSYNFHAYTDVFSREKLWEMVTEDGADTNWYYTRPMEHFPLVQKSPDQFLEDAYNFVTYTWERSYQEPFFYDVAVPMYLAWTARKERREFRHYLEAIQAADWRLACEQWIDRREAKGAVAK